MDSVSAALHELHHGTDPERKKRADSILQRLQQECDVPTALCLLISDKVEEQFFAAQVFLHRATVVEDKAVWDAQVLSRLFDACSQLVTKEKKIGVVPTKLFACLAAASIRCLLHTENVQELQGLEVQQLFSLVTSGQKDLLSSPLLFYGWCAMLPEQFKSFQCGTVLKDVTTTSQHVYRILQRSCNLVLQRAALTLEECRDSMERMPQKLDVWVIECTTKSCVETIAQWVTFSDMLPWGKVIEYKLVPALLWCIVQGTSMTTCTDTLAEVLTLPAKSEELLTVVRMVVELSRQVLASTDVELLKSVCTLLAACMTNTLEVLAGIQAAPQFGFRSAKQFQDEIRCKRKSWNETDQERSAVAQQMCQMFLQYTSCPCKTVAMAAVPAWVSIQDCVQTPDQEAFCTPLYEQVLLILLNQCRLSSSAMSEDLSEEDEDWRHVSQDALQSCFMLLHDKYFEVCAKGMADGLASSEDSAIEASLFAFHSVGHLKVNIENPAVEYLLRNLCRDNQSRTLILTTLKTMETYPNYVEHRQEVAIQWMSYILKYIHHPHIQHQAIQTFVSTTKISFPDVMPVLSSLLQGIGASDSWLWGMSDQDSQTCCLTSLANLIRNVESETSIQEALHLLMSSVLGQLLQCTQNSSMVASPLLIRALRNLTAVASPLSNAQCMNGVALYFQHLIPYIDSVVSRTVQLPELAAEVCGLLLAMLLPSVDLPKDLVRALLDLLCREYAISKCSLCFNTMSTELLKNNSSHHLEIAQGLEALFNAGCMHVQGCDVTCSETFDSVEGLFSLLVAASHAHSPTILYRDGQQCSAILQLAIHSLHTPDLSATRAIYRFLEAYLQSGKHDHVLVPCLHQHMGTLVMTLAHQIRAEVVIKGSSIAQGSRGAALSSTIRLLPQYWPQMAQETLMTVGQKMLQKPEDQKEFGHMFFTKRCDQRFRSLVAQRFGNFAWVDMQ